MMVDTELERINAVRTTGAKYTYDNIPMKKLATSPEFKVIGPTKVGDGYWNFEKMSHQTEDVM